MRGRFLSAPHPVPFSFPACRKLINGTFRNCPRCKVPRRATKTLTISRLPPVLLIQLKRFSTQNGVFWDKSETPVIYPVKGLDLSRYVHSRQPTGKEDVNDPRTQMAPFRYDLYGVSNHMGNLSSGHCESPPSCPRLGCLHLCRRACRMLCWIQSTCH